MDERNSWEIEAIKKNDDKQDAQLDNHETRLRTLESFKDATVEKLITVFNMIEEIREGDRWVRRVITSALITALVGAISTVIIWLIKM